MRLVSFLACAFAGACEGAARKPVKGPNVPTITNLAPPEAVTFRVPPASSLNRFANPKVRRYVSSVEASERGETVSMNAFPRPPLAGLKRQLQASRAKSATSRDAFLRETYTLPREAARVKAREWFELYPKAAYWTSVESWRLLPGDEVEFTMRRLPTAD